MSYLYFIQAGDENGPVKIGHSDDVERRLATLQTGNHLPLRLLVKCEHEEAAEVERGLHYLLSDHRLEGEWFSVTKLLRIIIACNEYTATPDDSRNRWLSANEARLAALL